MKKEEEGGVAALLYNLLVNRMGFPDKGPPRELRMMAKESAALLHEGMTAESIKINVRKGSVFEMQLC